MNPKHRRVFLGLFFVITPPALLLLSAAMSVRQERLVRDDRIPSAPVWDVLFPLALVACFLCIPLGAYIVFKSLADH